MRKPFVAVLLSVAITLSWSATAAAESAKSLAARLGKEIETTTKPEKGSSIEWGTGVAVIDAPTEAVLRVIENYERYREFMPHFQKSRVLAQRGARALAYLEATVAHGTVTLWAQVRLSRRTNDAGQHIFEADMLKGNMSRFVARWELTPVNGGERTLVRFRLLADPDLPLPSSVFTHQNKKSARRSIRALRDRVHEQLPALRRKL